MSTINPALLAYLNLPEVEDSDVKKSSGIVQGLLGKRGGSITKAKDSEKTPIERVALYAASIRKARRELS